MRFPEFSRLLLRASGFIIIIIASLGLAACGSPEEGRASTEPTVAPAELAFVEEPTVSPSAEIQQRIIDPRQEQVTVHSAPDSKYTTLAALEPWTEVTLTGKSEMTTDGRWLEIRLVPYNGWVNERDVFDADDPRLVQFATALLDGDDGGDGTGEPDGNDPLNGEAENPGQANEGDGL